MFVPGKARLRTKPEAIGSETIAKTIGIALVASRAACAAVEPGTQIRSTFDAASSRALSANLSEFWSE